MKKLINITHTDLDGVGCTALCKHFAERNGYEVEFFNCGYSTVNDRVREVIDRVEAGEVIDMVLITDISIKEGTNIDVLLNRMVESNPNMVVRLLDHHATATWLNKYDWAEVNEKDSDGIKRCGTWWTYQFLSEYFGESESDRIQEIEAYHDYPLDNYDDLLSQDPVFEFVKAVDLFDTWKWVEDYPDGKPFELAGDLNKLLKIKGLDTFLSDCQDRFNTVNVTYTACKNYHSALISKTDELVTKYKEDEIKRQIAQKDKELMIGRYRFEIQTEKQVELMKKHLLEKYASDKNSMFSELRKWKIGSSKMFNVGVVYCNDNLSEVGNALSKNHKELDFIILISLPGTISFRCCKNLEVPLGIIANVIGFGQGGGHPQSSGTPIKFAMSKGLMEEIVYGLDLR
jgi:oligoribonuclease NrnB/cAMP/cGMP phosphodiesterase (DHH superfamily)